MSRTLSQREQFILIVCVLAALVCAGFYGLYKPFNEKTQILDKQIQGQKRQLNKNLATIQRSEELTRQYKALLSNFKQTRSDEEVMSAILNEIEQVANELQLKITDLKPKLVKPMGGYNQFSVTLTIDSDFKDIINFLYVLQSEPHLFGVIEIRFDKNSQRSTSAVKTTMILDRILIPEK